MFVVDNYKNLWITFRTKREKERIGNRGSLVLILFYRKHVRLFSCRIETALPIGAAQRCCDSA